MALVNPQIAMSYRPTVEYQPRNALAEAAQIQQIIGGQRQAEMADMQMEDLRRERGVLGQIAAAISAKGGPDLKTASLLMMQNPKTSEQGYNIYQALQKQQRFEDYERRYGGGADATTPTSTQPAATEPAGEIVAAPIAPPAGTMREIAPGGAIGVETPLTRGGAAPTANALTPAAAPAANALAPAALPPQDVNALTRRYNLAVKAGSPDAPVILKQIEAALRVDPSELRTMQALGYPLTQAGYSAFRSAQMNRADGAPVAVIGPDGKPRYVTREQAVGQTPFTPASVQVLGMGPGREPPAPTIAQIQDPTNPSQMITIDARRYQGGGVGSPGVIGTSGKTAPAAAAAIKQEQGQTKSDVILSQLELAYGQLKNQKAIPSVQTGVLTNVLASISASGPGQTVGRAVGSSAQVERDVIKGSRNQLLLAIKDATGLSAQQLNSNMELQTWLNSLSDPSVTYEANERILQNVRKFIDSGGKYTAKPGGAAPAAPPAGGATGGWSVVR